MLSGDYSMQQVMTTTIIISIYVVRRLFYAIGNDNNNNNQYLCCPETLFYAHTRTHIYTGTRTHECIDYSNLIYGQITNSNLRWRKIAERSGKHGRSVAGPRKLLEKATRQTSLRGNLLPFPAPASSLHSI